MSRKVLLLALAAAMVAPLAQAHDSLATVNSSVRLFAGAHHLDYTEYDPGTATKDGILDTEKGAQQLLGANVSWQFVSGPLKNVFVQVDARHAHGKTKYDGYLQSQSTPELIPYTFDNVKAVTTETAVKLGYAFSVDQGRGQLTPYVAHGTYRWQRNSSASPYGYREDYRHNYVAFGTKWQYQFAPKWTFELDGAVGRTRKAGLDIPDWGLNFDLGSSEIATLNLALTQKLTDRIDVRYALEGSRFGYGKSIVKSGFMEPESDSNTANLTVGLGYRF